MDALIKKSLSEFVHEADILLNNNISSAYCYGSAVCDDFHIGYSDLDFFIIVENAISEDNFQKLSSWRTVLKNSGHPHFSVLEGEIISKKALKNDVESNVIYWGTSSEKLNRKYALSGFSLRGLINSGFLIYGEDIRKELPYPGNEEMLNKVNSLIETIRKYATITNEGIHSLDWLFLISQSIYWLKLLDITGKTAAAKWIVNNCDYSWTETLKKAIFIRQSPVLAKSAENKDWLKSLGPTIQDACDSLVAEKNRLASIIYC